MKRLTIKDIAKKAGVSVTTVSFVLNNNPRVRKSTREKVQRIIDEEKFKPSLSSKKLVGKKSFNICLMMNPFSSLFDDIFYFEITRGIINRGMKYNYNVIISRPIMSQTELPDIIYSGDVDGIIFMQNVSRQLVDKAAESGLPFIIIDSYLNDKSLTSLNPNYEKATFDAASYLINHGHKNIAFISKPDPHFEPYIKSGFNKAITDFGLDAQKNSCTFDATDEDSAYEAAKLIFKENPLPTAILCSVDSFAIGVMRYADEMKIRIPEDVSIIGIDDIILSRYTKPKLTSVGIDKESIGNLAMDMIYQKIKGENPESVLLPMEIVERNSVKNI